MLERAVGYALCAARAAGPRSLSRPTPCRGWDLRRLLLHAGDSLTALREGVETGYVGLFDADGWADPVDPADPAAAFRARAGRLLAACAAHTGPPRGRRGDGPDGRYVAVAGLPLEATALVRAGALEIAVHGWDIAQATGLPRPVPAGLATVLLRTARQLVPGPAARPPLFGPPVTVEAEADPSDRLVAFLGRDPYGRAG